MLIVELLSSICHLHLTSRSGTKFPFSFDTHRNTKPYEKKGDWMPCLRYQTSIRILSSVMSTEPFRKATIVADCGCGLRMIVSHFHCFHYPSPFTFISRRYYYFFCFRFCCEQCEITSCMLTAASMFVWQVAHPQLNVFQRKRPIVFVVDNDRNHMQQTPLHL